MIKVNKKFNNKLTTNPVRLEKNILDYLYIGYSNILIIFYLENNIISYNNNYNIKKYFRGIYEGFKLPLLPEFI